MTLIKNIAIAAVVGLVLIVLLKVIGFLFSLGGLIIAGVIVAFVFRQLQNQSSAKGEVS